MDIPYLIQLLNNKMAVLTNGKVLAFNSGDMETINKMDAEIIATQDTLNKLVMLQTITNAANAANTTPAELISTGLEASQNRPIVIDNATACLELYNISTYATDPLHERKVADILEVMGAMETSGTIDTYIGNEAIGSPLNGHMILTSASKYSVDVRLLMALIEQDSNFGTAGLAVSTRNPGNVGNTDSGATVTYDTWEQGVDAVAAWLNDHRIVKTPVEAPVVPDVVVPLEPVNPPAEIPVPVAPVQNQATTTPPVVAPIVAPVQATSTPNISTTTPNTIDIGTTTPNIIDQTSTTTPPTTSTTTEPTINIEIPPTSTTTPVINLGDSSNATTTSPTASTTIESVLPTEATSTPEITSTSTQGRILKVKRSRV